MRRALFWSAAGTIVYTYVVFPLLVLLRAAIRPRPHRSEDITPSLTVVIAARNEAAVIGAKLENLLSLDYPPDRLEVVVASDGCNDGTDAVVRRYENRGVRLVSLPRSGKAAALEAAVAEARGDVLVFSDANSMFDSEALRALTRPLADPTVGGVAGDQRYQSGESEDGIVSGERSYWDFERRLKAAESRAGNVISATGAIYAVRRSLFRSIPAGVTDDFFTSTGVIVQGYRLVFAPDAVAFEPVSHSREIELGRKVRVMTRGLHAVLLRRELLDARRHGFYALQLLTHKLLRRTMVVPLMGAAVASPFLWRRGPLYRAAAVAQATLYGLGAGGVLLARKPVGRRRILALPAFFCLVNAASASALWNLLRGRRIDRWEPRRPNGGRNGATPASHVSTYSGER